MAKKSADATKKTADAAKKAADATKKKEKKAGGGGKFDSGKIKEFMIAKGERVGLAVAAALMVLLLLSGIGMGLGTRSQHDDIKKAANSLLGRVSGDTPSSDPGKEFGDLSKLTGYGRIDPGQYALTASLFDPGAVADDRVFNPPALPLVGALDPDDEKEKVIHLDVVRAAVLQHQVSTTGDSVDVLHGGTTTGAPGIPGGVGAVGGSPMPGMPGDSQSARPAIPIVNNIKPTRMMVVTAMFPYQRQLEAFQKALRKHSIQEVAFDEKIAPKFAGLDVIRAEVVDGRVVEWTKLFFQPPQSNDGKKSAKDQKFEVHGDWKDLLRFAPIDRQEYVKAFKYVKSGLVTPLPALAEGTYPEIDLPGISVKDKAVAGVDPMNPDMPGIPGGIKPGLPGSGLPGSGLPGSGGVMPNPGQPTGAKGGTIKPMSMKDLAKKDKALAEKLSKGKFNFFDPFGEDQLAKKTTGTNMYGQPTLPMPPGGVGNPPGELPPSNPEEGEPMEGMPGSGQFMKEIPENLLVRFVDVGVKPGKTYKYFIRVRIENPNFDKKDRVAYPYLADFKELLSAWTETPAQYVDEEFHYYVVDQFDLLKQGVKKPHPISKDTATKPYPIKHSPYEPDQIAVQIHRWVETARPTSTNSPEPVGAWAIADRLLVKRGQELGKNGIEVPLPLWNEKQNKFEPPAPRKQANPTGVVQEYKGMLVDFVPKGGAPLVVDFKGGESDWYELPDRGATVDRSAVHMLVLTPDGKLLSYNSREDSDAETPRGEERVSHLESWLTLVQAPASQVTPMPGEGGLPGSPGGTDP